jgi:hypothetical protein
MMSDYSLSQSTFHSILPFMNYCFSIYFLTIYHFRFAISGLSAHRIWQPFPLIGNMSFFKRSPLRSGHVRENENDLSVLIHYRRIK